MFIGVDSDRVGNNNSPAEYVLPICIAVLSLMLATAVYWGAVPSSGMQVGLVVLLLFQGGLIIAFSPDRDRDPLNLLALFTVVYLVYFGLRSVFLIIQPEQIERFGAAAPELMAEALYIANISLSCFVVGYLVPVGHKVARKIRPLPPLEPRSKLVATLVILCAMGFILRYDTILRGWHLSWMAGEYAGLQPSWYRLVDYFGALYRISLVIYTVWVWSDERPGSVAWVVWGGLISMEVLYAFLSGSKFDVGYMVLVVVMTLHYTRRRLTLMEVIGVGAFSVGVIFPMVTIYRGAVDYTNVESGEYLGEILYALGRIVHRFTSAPGGVVEEFVPAVLNRVHGIDSLMAIAAMVPERVPFLWGETVVGGVVRAAVPAFVWPGKEQALRKGGDLMYETIWQLGETANSGISITLPGELYLNFGMLGVTVGMFVVGIAYRLVYEYLGKTAGTVLALAIYLFCLRWLLHIEVDLRQFANMIKQAVVFILPVAWLLTGGRIFTRRSGGVSS